MPSRVGCSVMSVSHTWLGSDAVKSCRTLPWSSTTASRSSTTAGPGLPALDFLRECEAKIPAIEQKPPNPVLRSSNPSVGDLVGQEPITQPGIVLMKVAQLVNQVRVVPISLRHR